MALKHPLPDDDVHEWLSFDLDGNTYQVDVTWLLSNWTCIYGDGCPGIGPKPSVSDEFGCCIHGAHFADKGDRKRTAEAIERLEADEWQFKPVADQKGGAIVKKGDDWVTRTHKGACIMLNRPGFPGGAGCALHSAAVKRGEKFLDWKPEVCWQVPMRLDYHEDDNDHMTYILREWKRRDWGDGGDDFHWWCTDDPLAFKGTNPVYVSSRDEIVELIGQAAYDRMVELLEARTTEVWLPHPSLKRPAAKLD